jgi:hypothetical protein
VGEVQVSVTWFATTNEDVNRTIQAVRKRGGACRR